MKDWIALPKHVVNSDYARSFKSKLDNFFFHVIVELLYVSLVEYIFLLYYVFM